MSISRWLWKEAGEKIHQKCTCTFFQVLRGFHLVFQKRYFWDLKWVIIIRSFAEKM